MEAEQCLDQKKELYDNSNFSKLKKELVLLFSSPEP